MAKYKITIEELSDDGKFVNRKIEGETPFYNINYNDKIIFNPPQPRRDYLGELFNELRKNIDGKKRRD